MKRQFNNKQRIALAMHSGWKCSICACELPAHWHSDHKIPYSKGGNTDVLNGQATCPSCNLKKGSKLMSKVVLRNWQSKALESAVKEFEQGKKLFLTHATPGGGKTIHGLSVFDELKKTGKITHVVILAPSTTLVKQWQLDAKKLYNFELKNSMLYQGMYDFKEFVGIVMTYQAMNENHEALRIFCDHNKTLIISDETHHIADGQSWGDAFRNACEPASHILALTGTPWASNGKRISYVEYDADGYAKPDFSYDKKTAIADSVCRVTEFYKKEATNLLFIESNAGEVVGEYGTLKDAIDDDMKGAYRKTLQSTQHFRSLFEDADLELTRIRRSGSPNAGGLIVAPDIQTAHKFKDELFMLTEQEYSIVHSKMPKPSETIAEFRQSRERWLISVDMVTEGVDIKRLQVCVFLSAKNTELFLRQVIGRIERITNNTLVDQTGAFYYTDMPEINAIVEGLVDENKAGLALKEDQIDIKYPPKYPPEPRQDDGIILEEVTTIQCGLVAEGHHFSHDIVIRALKKRRCSPAMLSDVPMWILCKVVQGEDEAVYDDSAIKYQESRDVPLTEKKDRIRSRIAKEVNRKLGVHLKRQPTGQEIGKAHTKINRLSGISKTDDSVSLEMFERKLDVVTDSEVTTWL